MDLEIYLVPSRQSSQGCVQSGRRDNRRGRGHPEEGTGHLQGELREHSLARCLFKFVSCDPLATQKATRLPGLHFNPRFSRPTFCSGSFNENKVSSMICWRSSTWTTWKRAKENSGMIRMKSPGIDLNIMRCARSDGSKVSLLEVKFYMITVKNMWGTSGKAGRVKFSSWLDGGIPQS